MCPKKIQIRKWRQSK